LQFRGCQDHLQGFRGSQVKDDLFLNGVHLVRICEHAPDIGQECWQPVILKKSQRSTESHFEVPASVATGDIPLRRRSQDIECTHAAVFSLKLAWQPRHGFRYQKVSLSNSGNVCARDYLFAGKKAKQRLLSRCSHNLP
jgi:hypothetical protein